MKVHQAIAILQSNSHRMGTATGYNRIAEELREIAGEEFARERDEVARAIRKLAKEFEVKKEKIRKEHQQNQDQISSARNALVLIEKERDGLLKMTAHLEEHPAWYGGPCLCAKCHAKQQEQEKEKR